MAPRKPAAEAAAENAAVVETVVPETPETAGALTVYAEVLAAVKAADPAFAEQHAKEAPQTFLRRLIQAIGDLPEDAWNALREDPTQNWFNAQADLITAGKDVELPEGFSAPTEAPAKPKTSGAAKLAEINAQRKADKLAREAAAAAGQPAPAPTAPAPKAAAPKAPAEPKAPRAEGVVSILRREVVKNPDISSETLAKMAEDRGLKAAPGTLVAIKNDTLATIRMARELGKWKD